MVIIRRVVAGLLVVNRPADAGRDHEAAPPKDFVVQPAWRGAAEIGSRDRGVDRLRQVALARDDDEQGFMGNNTEEGIPAIRATPSPHTPPRLKRTDDAWLIADPANVVREKELPVRPSGLFRQRNQFLVSLQDPEHFDRKPNNPPPPAIRHEWLSRIPGGRSQRFFNPSVHANQAAVYLTHKRAGGNRIEAQLHRAGGFMEIADVRRAEV